MLQGEHSHWRTVEFDVHDQFVEVSAGDTPADPEGRGGMIGCGGALHHLKLTLKRHGCLGRVDLFPDLDQPNLAARVYLGAGGAWHDIERRLAQGMETECARATSVSSEALDCLRKSAMCGHRSWLEFAHCERSRQRLMGLVRATVRGMRTTEIQVRNETVVRSFDGRWRLARFTGGMLQQHLVRWRKPALAIKVQTEPFDTDQASAPDGVYAVLKTKTDDKRGWLAAGQTLCGLLLRAQNLGLACTPFPNALGRTELREELRTAVGHKGFMQVIVCFGASGTGWLAGTTQLYAAMASPSV